MGRELLLPVLDEALASWPGSVAWGSAICAMRSTSRARGPRTRPTRSSTGSTDSGGASRRPGIERVPAAGQVVLVVNRGGSLVPCETLMIALALREAHPAPRLARPLVDPWLARAALARPLIAASRRASRWSAGALRRVLARDEAAVLLPEGDAALAKPFGRRYRLARFGAAAFARVGDRDRRADRPGRGDRRRGDPSRARALHVRRAADSVCRRCPSRRPFRGSVSPV